MPRIVRALNSCLGFGLVWGALIIVISLWAGIAWLFSPLIFAASFMAAFFLRRKFPFEFGAPATAWGIAALVLALVLAPVLLSGGVAANQELRRRLRETLQRESLHVSCLMSHVALSGDNALMIALAAFFTGKKADWKKVEADANLKLSQ